MEKTYILHKNNIWDFSFDISQPSIVFLRWDLWAGKTTISSQILSQILHKVDAYTSPTYVYYNKYEEHYHFDLYRIKDYEEFIHIWGEEIFDNNTGVILVEWPDIVAPYYKPDIEIYIEKTSHNDERFLKVTTKT